MKCALVGSRYFGATVFDALPKLEGVTFTRVVTPAADDRLALAAQAAGVELHVLADPKIVPGDAIAEGTDLIVAAHTHARVSKDALARARLGGIGYHPSLLPRHRGIAAVEWTILEGDPIAGGSVYHLADGWDAGAVAAQDWCFVRQGETARELWERALAPIGLALLSRVVEHARDHGALPATAQDARFATRAPMLRKLVVSHDEAESATTSLVATVLGIDRPGIVRLIAETAERFGASWAASSLSRHAGEFAGAVQFEVPRGHATPLADALRGLASGSLRVDVASSGEAARPPGQRPLELELVGDDGVGIVRQLSHVLAGLSISIETLRSEVGGGDRAGRKIFKVNARLSVPKAVATEALRQELYRLAGEMKVDIALGD